MYKKGKRVIRKKKDRRRLNRKYKDKSEKYLTFAQKSVKYNKKQQGNTLKEERNRRDE